MGPLVLDKHLQFHDVGLNRSRDIPPETVEGGIFDAFPLNFRLEVGNDVISGTTVDSVAMDVPIKFGDSSSNGFRDIRGTEFVSNERTLAKPIQIVRNATAFRLKTISPPIGGAGKTPHHAFSVVSRTSIYTDRK